MGAYKTGWLASIAFVMGAAAMTAEPPPLRVLAFETRPFFYRGEAGRPAGFEHALLAGFADAQNRSLEVIWVDQFDALIPRLVRGDGDLIAATMTITEVRKERVDFTRPYFANRVVAVVREDSEDDDLVGMRVATISGTTYQTILSAIDGTELVYADNEQELFEMVAAGEADGLACDVGIALLLQNEYEGLRIAGFLSATQDYGFAVPLGDPLRKKLDRYIARLHRSGAYGDLVTTSFGDLGRTFLEAMEEGG